MSFEGNGNTSMSSSIFDAYCVTYEPFARLEVPYFETIYKSHCLLRGFDKNLTGFRDQLKPEAVRKLLLSDDYNSFNLGLENGPHVAIPKSINGDFSLHTAPSGSSYFHELLRPPNTNHISRPCLFPPPYAIGPNMVALAAHKYT